VRRSGRYGLRRGGQQPSRSVAPTRMIPNLFMRLWIDMLLSTQ